ncbi:substrate-binding domain-containing protein [Phytohabitans rumicis]|uniref:ABC transporter substrate-binding protein n=1 Tax=Phytohabitans rumicis TaxID=1076125 RepID=A0A6V8KTP2_9ACTN|nr:hypothetical protein Prum_021250 [Phytohabitans rumicis]
MEFFLRYRPAHRAAIAVRSSFVVVVGASLGAVLLGSLGAGYASGVIGSDGCANPLIVDVAAAPAIAPLVTRAAADVPADTADGCFRITVKALESASVADRLSARRPAGLPHAWLPESSWWLRQAGGGEVEVPDTGTSVASSPVVLAVTEAVATDLGAPETPLTWAALLRRAGPARALGLRDPAVDPVGLFSLLEIRRLAGETDDPGAANAQILRRLSRTAAPAGADLLSRVGGDAPEALEGLFGSEQAILAYNALGGNAPLIPVYPDPATPALDYPFVVLPGASDAQRTIAERLLAAVRDGGAGALSQVGLRTPDGAPVREGGPAIQPAPLPPPATVDETLRDWAGVNLSARMHSVVDVSGSMAIGAGEGRPGSPRRCPRPGRCSACSATPPRSRCGSSPPIWRAGATFARCCRWCRCSSSAATCSPRSTRCGPCSAPRPGSTTPRSRRTARPEGCGNRGASTSS